MEGRLGVGLHREQELSCDTSEVSQVTATLVIYAWVRCLTPKFFFLQGMGKSEWQASVCTHCLLM